jgi:threonine dehydratase
MMSENDIRKELLDTTQRIHPYIHRTPILTSKYINSISTCEVYFKCENFQKMGAFKMRGASNAISKLSPEDRNKGVVTHSSGNHAQALSLAAKMLGVNAYIVMPSSAPPIKRKAVESYGGKVCICEPTLEAREATAKEIMDKYQASFIHPSNNIDVIYGQGTAALELLEEEPDLDCILVPVGGGGLLAGTALAASKLEK